MKVSYHNWRVVSVEDYFLMRANYSPIKSLVPPTRFQNPDPRTLTLHLTLTLTNVEGGTRDLVGE